MLLTTIAVALAAACGTDSPVAPADVTVVSAPPTQPAQSEGGVTLRWSDASAWPGGVVPRAGAAVVIGRDTTIVLDVVTPALASVTVHGTLRLDEQSTATRPIGLTATRVIIEGRLQGGTESAPFTGRATITLTGDESDADVGTAKMLGVYPGGALELHGEQRTGWVRLAQTAAAGATTLVLDRAVDWRAGDRLVIASTDFEPAHAEVVTVRDVQGASVTLAGALAFRHWGATQTIDGRAVEERAEVGLLTRNIVVQGDAGSAATGFGGHIMAMQGSTLRIEGVELTRVGQRGRMARYPIHWHMMGDAPGQYARRNSISVSYNRCVTVHGTHDVTVAGNVCYDHLGHGYFLEDGIETRNVIRDNLGVLTKAVLDARAVIPTDAHPATFWITNPDNEFVGNVAAGSQGSGFWFALPQHPTGLSATTAVWPAQTPLRRFEGNVSHSNAQDGLHVDNGPMPNGQTNATDYQPHAVPGDRSSPVVTAVFRGYVAWKNQTRGLWTRGQGLRIEDAVLSDNGVGAQVAAPGWGARTVLAGTLIVGQSANDGVLAAHEAAQGFRIYDGPWQLDGVTFANFDGAGQSALSPLEYNAGVAMVSNAASGVRMVNATPLRLNALVTDGDRNASVKDLDGSITGIPGSTIVADAPLRVDATCRRVAAARAQFCTTPQVGLLLSSLSPGEVPFAPVRVRRDDGVSESRTGLYDGRTLTLALPVGHGYAMGWAGTAPRHVHVEVTDLAPGQWVDLELPTAAQRIDVRHRRAPDDWELMRTASSRSELERVTETTSYLDVATGRLFVRIVGHAGHRADDGCVLEIQTAQ